jgi:hypothetical protein
MRTNSHHYVSSFIILFTTVFLVVLLPFTAQAQILIGGGLGGTRSDITKPNKLAPGASWNYRFGFSAGLLLDLPISGDIRLCPEIHYIQKGFNGDGISTNIIFGKVAVTNSYIELPIYMKYSLGGNYLHWFLLGGPTIGYLLSSNSDVTDNQESNGNIDTKGLDLYKSYDLTISVGIGLEYPLSSGCFIVPTLRYYHGVINVFESTSGPAYAISQCYSRTIQLTVGIMFPVL